jgi:hypothetical protein
MRADYYIAQKLAMDELNCYRRFFEAFEGSNFLTFNYDSLPETLLFRLGRWFPHDGYSVQVDTYLPPPVGFEIGEKKSSTLVLHLHGSLCIRTSESEIRRFPGQTIGWLTPREQPLYSFDPSSISANFAPFERATGMNDSRDRIIAPVPNKSEGLKEAFVRDMYRKALALMRAPIQ